MDQGFDVLVAQITPWQLLWPVKGSQVGLADNVPVVYFKTMSFLASGARYSKLHGPQRELQTDGPAWIFGWWLYVGRVPGADAKGQRKVPNRH